MNNSVCHLLAWVRAWFQSCPVCFAGRYPACLLLKGRSAWGTETERGHIFGEAPVYVLLLECLELYWGRRPWSSLVGCFFLLCISSQAKIFKRLLTKHWTKDSSSTFSSFSLQKSCVRRKSKSRVFGTAHTGEETHSSALWNCPGLGFIFRWKRTLPIPCLI